MDTFDDWARNEGLDMTTFDGDYFNEITAAAYSGWQAHHEVDNQLLYEYGICTECHTHYTPMEDRFDVMQCNCTIDGLRKTKIIEMLNPEIWNYRGKDNG